jgi:hypothetical protein
LSSNNEINYMPSALKREEEGQQDVEFMQTDLFDDV